MNRIGSPLSLIKIGEASAIFEVYVVSGHMGSVSHSECAVARLRQGSDARRGESQPQGRPGLDGVEDAVVPQAGGGEVGVALALVLLEDRPLEFRLGQRISLSVSSSIWWNTCFLPTIHSVSAAESPLITLMRLFGQEKRKRGS